VLVVPADVLAVVVEDVSSFEAFPVVPAESSAEAFPVVPIDDAPPVVPAEVSSAMPSAPRGPSSFAHAGMLSAAAIVHPRHRFVETTSAR